ncbi:unnamed protein product [Ectocarpus sp. 12 AP-2014]
MSHVTTTRKTTPQSVLSHARFLRMNESSPAESTHGPLLTKNDFYPPARPDYAVEQPSFPHNHQFQPPRTVRRSEIPYTANEFLRLCQLYSFATGMNIELPSGRHCSYCSHWGHNTIRRQETL